MGSPACRHLRLWRVAVSSRRIPLLLLALGGCGPAETPVEENPDTVISASAGVATTTAGDELVFDREFAFLSLDVDSPIILSWFFRSRFRDTLVHQEMTAWWTQEGEWEMLAEETAEVPPARSPWRIVPGSTLRLLVGPEDRIQSLLLRAPPGELETALGELVAEWTAPGSESVRLYQGRTTFPAGPVDGIVIEISRRWDADEDGGPGDWIFVHAGADLQFFMAGEEASGTAGGQIPSQGWSRTAFADARRPNLAMHWEEIRPFESARRDIPVRWTLTSSDGEVSGALESVSSHLTVEESDGPILPLFGLFEVAGTLEIQGEAWPVAGLIRHAQW